MEVASRAWQRASRAGDVAEQPLADAAYTLIFGIGRHIANVPSDESALDTCAAQPLAAPWGAELPVCVFPLACCEAISKPRRVSIARLAAK